LLFYIEINTMYKILCFCLLISQTACSQATIKQSNKSNAMPTKENAYYSRTSKEAVIVPDSVWKQILSPEVYAVAREKGTERPFTSAFETSKAIGTYHCKACGNPLFKSDTKFDSGCGWPSFYEPVTKQSIIYTPDNTHGMKRTEVQCGKCKAHLGHVFEDGPPPTGLRYCINGVILDFDAK